MRIARFAALLGFMHVAFPALAADQDQDLQFIPQAVQQAPPAAVPAATAIDTNRNYLEDAFSLTPQRGNLAVPFPSPAPSRWEDRLFLDSRDEWRLRDNLRLTYSGRFNLRAANDLDFPSHQTVLNEVREAYLTWRPVEGAWLDLGRVNLKSGVAVGFNPTDFFRTRSVVEPLTVDPTVLREDRLGTLMLRGQYIWPGGSVTLAYAPRVTQPTAIYNHIELPSFDPMLDRTNAQNRFLLKVSPELHGAFSVEGLLYQGGNRTQIGANLTASVGQRTIAYLEWAGGADAGLIQDALAYGRQTGSFPANAPAPLPADSASRFRNEVSLGFSYVPAGTRLTLNIEYHYNGAGMTQQAWHNWFAAAARRGNIPGVYNALWYIRSYAVDQQQLLSQHTAFVRAAWVDAFVPKLDITALANVSLQDGSGLTQITADYYLSRNWTVGGLASVTFGGRRSDFGSLPQAGGILLRLVRYL